ncbi:MAG: Rab family GTPase [Promethearchaeota archaeon]
MTTLTKKNYRKIIVCGEGGIGKTTLLTAFQKGYFSEVSMTLGLQPHIIHLNQGTKSLALQIWDLGGQKHFFDMGVYKKYCQGAHGAVICFDLSELDTLEKIPQWIDLLPMNIPKILVGTKKDVGGDIKAIVELNIRKMNLDDVFVRYLETSAKYNLISIYEVFKELLMQVCSIDEEESAQIIQNYLETFPPGNNLYKRLGEIVC